ncbi:MAG: 5-oxoprolinase subunit PxpB [Vicingaceae bacterium]
MRQKINITTMGHQCILIQWEKEDSNNLFETLEFLKREYPEEILEMVPTYRELAIYLHLKSDLSSLIEKFKIHLPIEEKNTPFQKAPIYRLPVCYDTEKGLDLKTMAKAKNCSIKELIKLHTEQTYRIHFLGFLPGFPYLSGLNKKLHQPRLRQPRNMVPAGSVGIAGKQTGVYPHKSPGGWNIIGRTPIQLFNIEARPPSVLQASYRLCFHAIDAVEFNAIQTAVQHNEYQIMVEYD